MNRKKRENLNQTCPCVFGGVYAVGGSIGDLRNYNTRNEFACVCVI